MSEGLVTDAVIVLSLVVAVALSLLKRHSDSAILREIRQLRHEQERSTLEQRAIGQETRGLREEWRLFRACRCKEGSNDMRQAG